jgi:hypothetical protein
MPKHNNCCVILPLCHAKARRECGFFVGDGYQCACRNMDMGMPLCNNEHAIRDAPEPAAQFRVAERKRA